MDPVVLDGTGSYDPDESVPLSYDWRQIAGPSVVITDANTATPTVSAFTQTEEIQECEFELVVSDSERTSVPDTVEVVIVPDFGENIFRLENESFDSSKPTILYFGGGDGTFGYAGQYISNPDWINRANIINFPYGYEPDSGSSPRTYFHYGDMIIVYLSSVAPDYKQLIQTSGWSTGGQPAIDVGLRLNMTYEDRRYAVNLVTFLDANLNSRSNYSEIISTYLASSVDSEQCWIDNYVTTTGNHSSFRPNMLNVGSEISNHALATNWYGASLMGSDMNQFNNGVVAGAFWSVVGPGKNLQLASTPDAQTYKFKWYGDYSSGYMDFYDEAQYPGRLPEPVTLIGPEDRAILDVNGALLTCKESENAVGYQLLFGSDPYRVMDYNIISDTPNPPNEVITTLPFDETWWTVKARDQYGSTIYADPIRLRKTSYIQLATNDANSGDEIVIEPGVYPGIISFNGKNLTLRSTNPNDPSVVAATVIRGYDENPVVTFSSGEDANCVLAGFTITRGKRGIYCSGSSPTITNCTITKNVDATTGGGICLENGSNPTLTNCTIINNSASSVGGGMYCQNSSPILTNCTFSDNSASFSGGGICLSGGSATLTNCILWGDSPDEIQDFTGASTMTYSDIQGSFPGEGNIDIDPLFANPSKGDYYLKSEAGRWDPNSQTWVQDDATSPGIDAGDPNSNWTAELWPHGKRINMGAFAGTPQASMSLSTVGNVADFNADDAVDGQDLGIFTDMWLTEDVLLAEDTNRDGLVNLLDLAMLAEQWLWGQ
jgi:hypothetical protein